MVNSTAINLRAPPALLAPLDAWIADQPEPKPSRPEAIRHALTDWLTGQGYVRHREDPEGAN
ncbi:ribbon-helix-helix domain-containing protein [Methylobacterium sp. E-016]|uniref:ribbon-helix-helix domain-containing protein n=1 Tax=Methylobacterium sp. E-016 TaxID=2836556 RepID=UPI001FB932E0|nr:ribbon-helix-helix domain-containing protein [Methylobacterium sp. E-016]MCJ2077870.1 ribbon-helix-helix domain-containing protein [Methylobacterium sp. E-016]